MSKPFGMTLDSLLTTLTSGGSKLSPHNFYDLLKGWLREHLQDFPEPVRLAYNLENYVYRDPSLYPTKYSAINPSEEIRALLRGKPDNFDALAMRIRNILWEIIAYQTDIECERCGHDNLRVLKNQLGKILLGCDLCAFTKDPNENIEITTDFGLEPATNADLINAKIIESEEMKGAT